MVFSSCIFLFFFLPIVSFVYWLCPNLKGKNAILILASLLFYAFGEPVYILLMIGSILVNYALARLIASGRRGTKGILAFTVVFNIGMLVVFKYSALFVETAGRLLGIELPVPDIALPIGISFYTFQALSYCIDVYRDKSIVQKNVWKLMLYISFFPQLIAGPIVKYHDIEAQLSDRHVTIGDTAAGIQRFVCGMGKKLLIANAMAYIVDTLYTTQIEFALTAWIVAVCYIFQIYFDFSGYSDMAMGLGYLFNMELPVNFRSPYKACSVKELWQRWHITLSRFFITYVYIPLGGSKNGKARTICNTMAVFALSGLWHGANWTYVAWGVMQGLLVVWDNLGIVGVRGSMEKEISRFHIPRWLGWFFTFSFFNLSLFFFRSENMTYAFQMFKNLFSFKNTGYVYKLAAKMDIPEFYVFKQAITMFAPNLLNTAYVILVLLLLLVSAFVLTRKNSLEMVESSHYGSGFRWYITVIFLWSIISFSQVSTFIYFNF